MCRCPCFIIRQQPLLTGVLALALLVVPCIIRVTLGKFWNGLLKPSLALCSNRPIRQTLHKIMKY